MSNTATGRARPLALITGILTALALVLGTASPASASINLSAPSVGPDYVYEPVTVSGAPPAMWSAANAVGMVVCNVAAPPYGGRCDQASEPAGGGTVSTTAYASGVTIMVDPGPWQDHTYLAGYPGTPVPSSFTTCKDSLGNGSQCAVIVSYYTVSGGTVTRLGAEVRNITFNP